MGSAWSDDGHTYTQPVTSKRQYRSLEEKQRIIEEALAEGVSVARAARSQRQSGLQLLRWPHLLNLTAFPLAQPAPANALDVVGVDPTE